jgi:hypothetical protein
VGDHGLLGGEGELELVAQERGELGLDLLGFGLRAGEPQEVIVGLCRLPGYAAWCGLLLVTPAGGVVHAA